MPTEFPEDVVQRRFFVWANQQCECVRIGCGHIGRCQRKFTYAERATSDRPWGWQADHDIPVTVFGPSTVENCRILCMDCHHAKSSAQLPFLLGGKKP